MYNIGVALLNFAGLLCSNIGNLNDHNFLLISHAYLRNQWNNYFAYSVMDVN